MENMAPQTPKSKNTLPNPHYVCTGGCKSVSIEPGKCSRSECPRARNPLTACSCRNGKHGKLLYLNADGISK